MPNNKLPPQIIKTWPDILGDIEVDVLPIEYLDSVRIFFTSGKVWEIDVAKSLEKNSTEDLELTIESIFEEYDDAIENVDFRLDTKRIKADIKKRTHQFMKKRR